MRWNSSIRQLTAMIQYSVPFETTWILRILLLISVALISACENEDIIKPQSQTEPSEPPLPVSEWYPAPKHRQQPAVYAPVPASTTTTCNGVTRLSRECCTTAVGDSCTATHVLQCAAACVPGAATGESISAIGVGRPATCCHAGRSPWYRSISMFRVPGAM